MDLIYINKLKDIVYILNEEKGMQIKQNIPLKYHTLFFIDFLKFYDKLFYLFSK